MDDVKHFLTHPLVAGLVGVTIAVAWHRPSWQDAVLYVVSGVFSALYGARPLVEWQGASDDWIPFVAMAIGIFSGSVFSAVLRYIHSGAAMKLIETVVKSKAGSGGSAETQGREHRGRRYDIDDPDRF